MVLKLILFLIELILFLVGCIAAFLFFGWPGIDLVVIVTGVIVGVAFITKALNYPLNIMARKEKRNLVIANRKKLHQNAYRILLWNTVKDPAFYNDTYDALETDRYDKESAELLVRLKSLKESQPT